MSWFDNVGQTVGGIWNSVANIVAPLPEENSNTMHSVSIVYI